jgi:hypothetical protein
MLPSLPNGFLFPAWLAIAAVPNLHPELCLQWALFKHFFAPQ